MADDGRLPGLHRLPETSTSHPSDPVPEEPTSIPELEISPIPSLRSSDSSLNSVEFLETLNDSDAPSTPRTEAQIDEVIGRLEHEPTAAIDFTRPRERPASTELKIEDETGPGVGQGYNPVGTKLVEKVCCGGGCCRLERIESDPFRSSPDLVTLPKNEAFWSLRLKLGSLSSDSYLTNIAPVPAQTVSLAPVSSATLLQGSESRPRLPSFVTPHPPYEVFSARIYSARELTKPGAEKRTYHFDLDVTDYPDEGGNVDFVVGGAVGLCAPNSSAMVDELFQLLGIPTHVRDRQVKLTTTSGRWPTIWGEDQPRELSTTRKELLTWCSDLQSYPPTKGLLRLLAEYATAENERKILMYLSSAQGQAAFCEYDTSPWFALCLLIRFGSLRTGSHLTVNQLLNAFPSSKPPLTHLLSVLPQLMPRFYSLSNDPYMSPAGSGERKRRLIEIAVSVHETADWRGGVRAGLGSGFLEGLAKKVIEASNVGKAIDELDVRVPIFRGLMANPLAREFVSDGPMLLIGAGVGIAPFRGFVQRRLKSANCANKVWVLQGVRDSLLDELYSGEWGVDEDKVKTVVQSRRGEGKYVQEEVRNQADLVWFIINSLDGRVFVCGSTKGMGEGVEQALIDVAREKGRLNKEEAEEFWKQKREGGQYITVSGLTFRGGEEVSDANCEQETW